jgi:hypothetical protein
MSKEPLIVENQRVGELVLKKATDMDNLRCAENSVLLIILKLSVLQHLYITLCSRRLMLAIWRALWVQFKWESRIFFAFFPILI